MYAVKFYVLMDKYDSLPIIEDGYHIYIKDKKIFFEYKDEIFFSHVIFDDMIEFEDFKKYRNTYKKFLYGAMKLSETISCLDITLKEDEIEYFDSKYAPLYLKRDGNNYKIYYFGVDSLDSYFPITEFKLTNDQIELFSKDQMAWHKYITENLI